MTNSIILNLPGDVLRLIGTFLDSPVQASKTCKRFLTTVAVGAMEGLYNHYRDNPIFSEFATLFHEGQNGDQKANVVKSIYEITMRRADGIGISKEELKMRGLLNPANLGALVSEMESIYVRYRDNPIFSDFTQFFAWAQNGDQRADVIARIYANIRARARGVCLSSSKDPELRRLSNPAKLDELCIYVEAQVTKRISEGEIWGKTVIAPEPLRGEAEALRKAAYAAYAAEMHRIETQSNNTWFCLVS